MGEKMKYKDMEAFLRLCKPFLKKAKEQEAGDNFVCNDDFSVLYRLLGDLGVWEWLNNTGRYEK